MKINYKLFSKHAERMVKGMDAKRQASRPVLSGINHDDAGTVTVTDSHRLYQARNVNAPRNTILHAVSGDEIDGAYPEVSQIIPGMDSWKAKLFIPDVKQFRDVLKAMLAVELAYGYKKDQALAELIDNQVAARGTENSTFSYELVSLGEHKADKMCFNLKYLYEAIDMFHEMNVTSAEFRSYGGTRPFTLAPDNNDDIIVVILPIRTY